MHGWSNSLRSRIGIAVVCCGISVCAAGQQRETGEVHGHVVDQVGATVRGSKVFVHTRTASEESFKIVTHSDANGNFTLVLSEGGYDVLVESPGFKAIVETVAVRVRKSTKVQFELKALDCSFPGINCDTFQ